MTTLLIVRHGQSTANKMDLFAGFYDADLEPQGLRQAQATADYLAQHYKVDLVYASDLKRAYKTGEAIASRFDVPVIAEEGLREISGGQWEGVHFPSLKDLYPKEFGLWSTDIGNAGCPGGETVRRFADRIVTTVERIAKENEGKTVVLATHATPIRVLHTMLLHGDLSAMQNVPWVSNASVTQIRYDRERWEMVSAGEDAHLAQMRTYLSGTI